MIKNRPIIYAVEIDDYWEEPSYLEPHPKIGFETVSQKYWEFGEDGQNHRLFDGGFEHELIYVLGFSEEEAEKIYNSMMYRNGLEEVEENVWEIECPEGSLEEMIDIINNEWNLPIEFKVVTNEDLGYINEYDEYTDNEDNIIEENINNIDVNDDSSLDF